MILFAAAPNQQELFFCLSSIFHPASFYLSFLQTRDIIQEIGKLVDISNTASTQQPVVQSFINLGIIIKSSELLFWNLGSQIPSGTVISESLSTIRLSDNTVRSCIATTRAAISFGSALIVIFISLTPLPFRL